eukprot:5658671-Karenia_brevis.AAC.1
MEVCLRGMKCRSTHWWESEPAQQQAWKEHNIQAIDGPPGTGKTFVQRHIIEKILDEGGHILSVFVTANAASRARE